MFTIRKAQLVQFMKILFPLLLLVLAVFEIQQTASGVDVKLLRHEVSQLQLWELVLILLVSLCAIIPMLFYDVILTKMLGIQLKARDIEKYCFRYVVLFNGDFHISLDYSTFFRDFPLLSEEKWLFLAVISVSLYAPVFMIIFTIRNNKAGISSFSLTVAVQLMITSIVEWLAIFLVMI